MLFKIFFLFVLAIVLALSAWMLVFRKRDGSERSDKLSPLDGIYLLSKGDREAALKFFIDLASEGSSSPSDYLTAAVLMRTVGDAKSSVHVLEALLLRRSTPPVIVRLSIIELIKCYRIIGNTHSASGCISSIKDRGHWDEIILLEAMIASDKGDFETAVSKFQRYQKLTGTDTSKDISAVYVAMAAKETEKSSASKHLKSALKAYPANHKAFFTLLTLTEDFNLCKDAIDKDMIRTKQDRIIIENICYKLSRLDELKELLIKKVQSSIAHPAPYLFLAAYYKKMGELLQAQGIIRDYIAKNAAANVVKKYYADIANDTFLESLFQHEKIYCCSICGLEFTDFAEVCQICGEVGTLNYKL
jgi:lipopolysaccharide biosynthesis regulator YciM